MKLLLDTHCWIWANVSPERLDLEVRAWIEDPANEIYLSSASVWELTIKEGLGWGLG